MRQSMPGSSKEWHSLGPVRFRLFPGRSMPSPGYARCCQPSIRRLKHGQQHRTGDFGVLLKARC
jgi:hypothetical protein